MTELSDQIIRLSMAGKTYNEIKAALGCSKGTIAYHLGAGQKEKSAKRQKDRRRTVSRFLQDLKQSTPCKDCGENYPYWMMQFDHLDNKTFQISDHHHKGISLEVMKEEIGKCDIVCANCHANRTHMRLVGNGEYVADLSQWYT